MTFVNLFGFTKYVGRQEKIYDQTPDKKMYQDYKEKSSLMYNGKQYTIWQLFLSSYEVENKLLFLEIYADFYFMIK